MSLHLDNFAYLLLLLLVPLLIYWNHFTEKRGKRHILFASRRLLRGSDQGMKTFFIIHLFYFKLLAFVLFIMALARPQALSYFDQEVRKGIDILITLDVSGSMASRDFGPKDRLEVAKDVISDFILKRTNDRLGLVVFAGNSYTRCPLTIEYDILKHFLSEVRMGEMEDGTALGMALATSVNRIYQSKSKTKIIILLTDGINNRGEIDPRDAARIAKDFNIKVLFLSLFNYYLFMTITDQKIDRYSLIFFPFILLLISNYLATVSTKILSVYLITSLLFLTYVVYTYHPVYSAYYSPLFGSTKGALNMGVYDNSGEYFAQAALYLNTKGRDVYTYVPNGFSSFNLYYKGNIQRDRDGNTEYVVTSYDMERLNPADNLCTTLDKFFGSKEHTIVFVWRCD